jgi:hypothetical protein
VGRGALWFYAVKAKARKLNGKYSAMCKLTGRVFHLNNDGMCLKDVHKIIPKQNWQSQRNKKLKHTSCTDTYVYTEYHPHYEQQPQYNRRWQGAEIFYCVVAVGPPTSGRWSLSTAAHLFSEDERAGAAAGVGAGDRRAAGPLCAACVRAPRRSTRVSRSPVECAPVPYGAVLAGRAYALAVRRVRRAALAKRA